MALPGRLQDGAAEQSQSEGLTVSKVNPIFARRRRFGHWEGRGDRPLAVALTFLLVDQSR
jgi:hypothetical protein